jgi:hypothetical protein
MKHLKRHLRSKWPASKSSSKCSSETSASLLFWPRYLVHFEYFGYLFRPLRVLCLIVIRYFLATVGWLISEVCYLFDNHVSVYTYVIQQCIYVCIWIYVYVYAGIVCICMYLCLHLYAPVCVCMYMHASVMHVRVLNVSVCICIIRLYVYACI